MMARSLVELSKNFSGLNSGVVTETQAQTNEFKIFTEFLNASLLSSQIPDKALTQDEIISLCKLMLAYHKKRYIGIYTGLRKDKKLVILEGQVNLDFIDSAFAGFNCYQFKIVLVHCENTIRHTRLHQERDQPELVNDNMENWAVF